MEHFEDDDDNDNDSDYVKDVSVHAGDSYQSECVVASIIQTERLPDRFGDLDKDAMRMGYAEFYSRSHNAVIRVYDAAGNVIETHEHAGDFKVW